MRLRLAEEASDLVAFSCSPAYEALRSLHVLGDVKSHPLHISWVLTARTRMSGELKSEFDRFAFWCARPLGFPEIWPPSGSRSWSEEISELRKTPVHNFAEPLIMPALARNGRVGPTSWELFSGNSDLRHRALAKIEEHHPASLPAMRELIADPERCRERFADFLDTYWQTCLAPDWPRLEQHLLTEITRCGHLAGQRGVPRMLAAALGHIELAETGPGAQGGDEIVIRPASARRGPEPMEITLTRGDQLLLVPSHFAWPKVTAAVMRERRGDIDRTTATITYALAEMRRQGQPPVPPEDLLKLLRSAGDPTRLKILQLLGVRARSTREIAGLLGFTEAAISKHLKLLAEAGWVEQDRHSYYVYYRLAHDARDNLTRGLDEILG